MAQLQAQEHQRNAAAVGAEHPDVFATPTGGRLAAIRFAELQADDAAQGVRRHDIDVMREAARFARTQLAPRASRRGK
jgi:hypothetical protein